jgi:dipeptidase
MRKALISGLRPIAAALAAGLAAGIAAPALDACTSVIVGRKASANGAVLFGHNEDDFGERVVNVRKVPRARHRPGETVRFRGGAEIPQAAETWALLWFQVDGLEYSDLYCNEWGVTVASDACPSREDDPRLTEGGAGFPLRRVVAERSRTAEEGVRIAGAILDRYGYPSSGRTLVICDRKEGWLLSIAEGKHWVAERVPDDAVTVLPNVYVVRGVRSGRRGDFVFSAADPAAYARRRGWWSPESDGPFDFAAAYRTRQNDSEALRQRRFDLRQWRGLSLLSGRTFPEEDAEINGLPFSVRPVRPVEIRDVMAVLRDHFEGTAYAVPEGGGRTPHSGGERPICHAATLFSVAAELGGPVPPALAGRIWTAFGRPDVTPYTAWYPAIAAAPAAFRVRACPVPAGEAFDRHFDPAPGAFVPDDSSAFWILKKRADAIDGDYFGRIGEAVEWRRAVEDDGMAGAERIERKFFAVRRKDRPAAVCFLTAAVDSLATEPLRRLKGGCAP